MQNREEKIKFIAKEENVVVTESGIRVCGGKCTNSPPVEAARNVWLEMIL
jgi:hypothetical protein